MKYQELMARFLQVAEHPDVQMKNYLAEGKKVVLTAPVYTPEEIIHAMGAVPRSEEHTSELQSRI